MFGIDSKLPAHCAARESVYTSCPLRNMLRGCEEISEREGTSMSLKKHPTALPDQNSPIAEQARSRTAHLDEVHIGDIHGAWGTIREGDTAPRTGGLARLL